MLGSHAGGLYKSDSQLVPLRHAGPPPASTFIQAKAIEPLPDDEVVCAKVFQEARAEMRLKG